MKPRVLLRLCERYQYHSGTVMRILSLCLYFLFVLNVVPVSAQQDTLRYLFIGAHPDDADHKAGGTAILLARAGHQVKFLSVTSGDAGHHVEGGGALARRRRAEAQEAARRMGITYETLDFHDGELLPTLDVRRAIIKAIRDWNADVVVCHRPNDYHPDHRYSGMVVQDAAILVQVPNLVTSSRPTVNNPVFLYFEDTFKKPNPFTPDVAIDVDAVFDAKMRALDAHVSQFHEYLPWVTGDMGEMPKEEKARIEWLKMNWTYPVEPDVRTALVRWYGREAGEKIQHVEAFEIAEYGTQPTEADLHRLFPMLPATDTSSR